MTQLYCENCGGETALNRDDETADCTECNKPGRAVGFFGLAPELRDEWREKEHEHGGI